jgi:hypothetical protein
MIRNQVKVYARQDVSIIVNGDRLMHIKSHCLYLGHLLVGCEELLVLRVLEVVLLDVSPQLLDALSSEIVTTNCFDIFNLKA